MNCIQKFNLPPIPLADIQEAILKTAEVTCLSAICGYGGAFFFSSHSPLIAAAYMGTVALVSFVAYQSLEAIKGFFQSPRVKYLFTVVQLLQIPIMFYLLPNVFKLPLLGSVKLEIVVVTAHFIAIPLFFHLAVKTWNDPTMTNIAAVAGVMLSLANGLRNYINLA